MSDLISRQALLDDIRKKAKAGFPANKNLSLYAESCVVHAPTVDAVPVRRGKWIEKEDWNVDDYYYTCSVCGEDFVTVDGTPSENLWNFCPNCGDDMRELPEPPEEDDHA